MRSRGILFLIAPVLLAMAMPLRMRFLRERADKKIEICLPWDETRKMFENSGLTQDWPSFLERCRLMGASSMSVSEDRLSEILASGKALVFSPSEIEKYKSLGVASDNLKPTQVWVRKDFDLAQRIASGFSGIPAGSHPTAVRKWGEFYILDAPASLGEPQNFRVRLDPESLKTLSAVGLSLVYAYPAAEPSPWPDQLNWDAQNPPGSWMADAFQLPALQSADWKALPHWESAVQSSARPLVVFEQQTPFLKTSPLVFGVPLLRGHTILSEEMKNQPEAMLLSRWLRAVQERSCRFLYFRPDRYFWAC
jgi:hypothetical protein